MTTLTQGAINAFSQNRDIKSPLLQVIDIKRIESNGGAANERFRLIISDGQFYTQAMLSTQLNDQVKSGYVQQNSIIVLNEYICNEVQGRNIVIILGVEVKGKAPDKIGNPVGIGSTPAAQPQEQMHPARPNANQTRQYAPQPSHGSFQGSGPVVRQPNMMQTGAGVQEHITPIQALNPYQNRWTIKARVTNKGDIRTWDKGGNNKGKLFSMECVDREGTEIRATLFREAVDQYYDMLQVGEVYTFSKGQVKMANQAYNTTNNDYEITFGGQCEIKPCANDATIKTVSINPVPIANIDPSSSNTVDVVGVVTEFGEIQDFTSKAGKPLTKMEVTLADDSNASVKLTMWGNTAREYQTKLSQGPPNQIIGLKGVKVSDYNGCSLSSLQSSTIFHNPDVPETAKLQSWLNSGGLSNQLQSKSQQQSGNARGVKGVVDRHTLSSFEQLGLGTSDKADYVDVNATITYVKRENMWYAACPEEGENKKVVQQTDGTWYCEKTNKTYPNCEYRYILSCLVSDSTGSRWITCFNETGIQVLGNKTADTMEALKQSDEAQFDQAILDANFKTYNMCLRVKEETRDEEARLRCSLVRLNPVDFVNESKQLLAAIEQYKGK